MKEKRMEREKLKKINVRKVVVCVVMAIVVAIAGLVMYSENVHKIGLIENIKHAIEEQVNPNSETNQVDATIGVDVTDIVNDDYVEHEHIWYEEYDETNHWRRCSICSIQDAFGEHAFTRTWTLDMENSCYPNNYYIDTCECGYSHRDKIPHEWNGTWFTGSIGPNYHDRVCSQCGARIGTEAFYDNTKGKREFHENTMDEFWINGHNPEILQCKLADGSPRPCGSSQPCAICGGPPNKQNYHVYSAIANNIIRCVICGSIGGTYEMSISEGTGGVNEVKHVTIDLHSTISDLTFTGGVINFGIVYYLSERDITWSISNDGKDAHYECNIVSLRNDNILGDGGINTGNSIAIDAAGFNYRAPYITQKPVVSAEIVGSSVEGWNTSTVARVNATEVYTKSADLILYCDGKEILRKKYIPTNNAFTDDIELTGRGITAGSKLEWKVLLTEETQFWEEVSSTYEMNMTNVDLSAPILSAEISSDTTWSKTKDLNVNYHDEGVGNDRVYLANMENVYGTNTDETGENVLYELTGDVYGEKKLNVFAVDKLGNYSMKTVTVSNLDNTAPVITGASLTNNKLTIAANDQKKLKDADGNLTMQEGSGVAKYRYITSDTRLENPVVPESAKEIVPETDAEGNLSNTITIDGINEAKYVYVVAIDAVGNVGEAYEVEVPPLVLDTKVNLEAANGHGGVDLSYNAEHIGDAIYRAYQKKEGSDEWESISTLDYYNEIEPIKVLNIYPVKDGAEKDIKIANFTYADGSTKNLPQSALLKVWMEGGSMGNLTFEPYAINPITKQKILYITPVSSEEFGENPKMIWDYDVMMFGLWNGNGDYDDKQLDKGINEIENYIKAGYGVLAGHDSIGYVHYGTGLGKLKEYFGIEGGCGDLRKPSDIKLIDYNTSWMYCSTTIEVIQNGLLTNFPYELPNGSKMTIPLSGTFSNAAKGNVWVTLVDGEDDYWGQGSIQNYYNAGGKGDPKFYLNTRNNTAAIMTGHSLPYVDDASTPEERKVLANTLFYLYQRTTATSFTDNSGQDVKAPNAPELQVSRDVTNNNIKVTYNSEDNGSTYSYYVQAYDQNDASILLATSNQRTETVTTGTKGYYYIIDNNSGNTDFDISTATYIENGSFNTDVSNNGKYVHMKAIDVAGNVSDPSVKRIEVKSTATIKLAGGILNGTTEDTTREEMAGTIIDIGTPTRDGYTFTGWEATKGTIDGTNYTYSVEDSVITATWRINGYGYSVEYYYNGLQDSSLTELKEANFGTIVESYPNKLKNGYKFEKTENLPLSISSNASKNVIKVYYVTDESQTKNLQYTVEYYKNDEQVRADTQTVSETVQYLQPDTMVVKKADINTTNKYAGYKLGKIMVNDTVVSDLPATVNSTDVIKVYYVTDNNQTKNLQYTVEYYLTGEKQDKDTQVETQTVQLLAPDVLTVDKTKINITNKYVGYKLDRTAPTPIPDTLDNGGVIKVYYIVDDSQRKDLSYTVQYYKDGVKVDADTQRETANVQVLEADTLTVNKANINLIDKYYGYKLDSEATGIIPTTIRDGGIINVYYVTDESQTKELRYTVEYYQESNKVVADTQVVTQTVQVLQPDTLGVDKGQINTINKYVGYKLGSLAKNEETITEIPSRVENGAVLKVYYVVDDSQTKNLKYTVEYYKGNDRVDKDTQTVTQTVQVLQPNTLTVDRNSINTMTKYDGYRLEQIRVNDRIVEAITDTVDNNDVIKVYFAKRNDLKYTVKYFDVETKEEIHEAIVHDKQVFEAIIVGENKNNAIDIDGYEFGHTEPRELMITTDESKNVINAYYSKVTGLSYTVNFLEKDTNKVIAPAVKKGDQTFGSVITASSEKIDIDGYVYDSADKESITIGTDASKNVINIYYTKRNDLSYTVNYLEKSTNKVLQTAKTEGNKTLDEIINTEDEVVAIDGYNYDSADKDVLVITTKENVINLYYTKRNNLIYTVNYLEKDTNEVLKDAKIARNVTFEAVIRSANEVVDIDGYEFAEADKESITIGTDASKNVINLYYTKRNDLSYVVNYIEKGSTKNIATSKTVRNVTFGTTVVSESEKIDIDGYNYDSAEKESITIGTSENVINLYYTKRTDLSYVVNYLEKGTKEVLHDAKTVGNKTFGEKVTTSIEVIDIDGYNYDSADKEILTITTGENVINLYYAKKNDLTYRVNYLEKDTNEVLQEPKIGRNKTFKEVVNSVDEKIDIAGYDYSSVSQESITIDADVSKNVINVYYTKRTDLSYVVNYYEKDTTIKVADSKTVEGKTYLSSVTENAIEVEGYNKENPISKTITIGVENNVINFYYTKRNDLSYVVNYLEKDTDTVLATAKVVENQRFKSEITERAIDINGYNKVDPTSQTISIKVSGNVINFYYVKRSDLNYKVNYLDRETNDVIHEQKVEPNQVFGTKITSSDEVIEIDGYVFESTDKTSITIGTGENVINIYYTRRNDLSYTMNFLEKGSNKVLADPVTVGNLVFETIVSSNGKAIDIEGYNFDSVDKKTLTIGTGVNEFNFYYTKRNDLSYTVNYLEQGSEKALAEAKVVNNKIFEEAITENAIDIVGYNKVDPTSKTITIKVSGNVINFYYTKRNDLKYTVKHYEEGKTDEIAPADTIENVVYETVIDSKTKTKTIDGYSYKSCTPEKLTVGVDESKNVINIYYTRVDGLTYTVNYVEKGNEANVLNPAKVVDKQVFGATVDAVDEVIEISGYNYDSVSADSITIGTDTTKNVITIYYTRRNDLSYTVNYLEQGSNEVLHEAKVVDKQVFEAKVTEEAIEISGYVKPVVTTQSITIGVDGNVINFYYTKRNDLTYVVNYYEEATTQKIADTKVVIGQTYKAVVRENAIEISGYNKLDPTTQTITIEVSNNVINFYYRRRNDLTYVVNYLEEGTNKKVVPSKTVNGQTYLTDVTEQAMPVDGYIAIEPTSKTIRIQVEGNEFNFYYKKRTDLSYTVNYLEQGSNEVLAVAKVVNGQTYEAEVIEEAIDIAGYNKVEPQRQSIIIDVENNVINFYYTKRIDLSYTVNYLEKNTDVVIAPAKVVGKQTYKATATEQAIEIDGYDKLDPTEKSITIEVANNVINFYYTKKDDLNYKVNYLEKDTNKVIHEQKVATGRTFDEVIIARDEVIEIDGYNYASVDKQSITIGTGENVINVYYTKRDDLRYTVNYLEKDTNVVLKAQKVANNVVFDTEVTIDAEKVDIDGYVYDSASPENFKVGTDASKNVMNIYYTRRGDLSYKVNYLDVETGDALHEQKVVSEQVLGTKIDSNNEIIDINGYVFDSFDKTSITIGTSENVINIYYIKRNDLSYTINFLEKDTNEVLAEPVVVRNQVFGATISSNGKAIAINGYNYHSADKRTITIGTNEEENVFNLYYTKHTDLKYKVNYIERETDKVLADQKVVSNRTFGEVIVSETEAISIDGYSFDGCDKETLTIGTEENVITIYYTKVNGLSYTVKYIDKDTDETIHAPKTEGNQKFEATILARNERIDIDGYVYDSCSKDRLVIGTGVNELTLYYIKRSDLNYKVNYIEKGTGNTIKDTKTVNGMTYKDEVYAEDELIDIDGYYFDSYDKEKIIIGTKENVINMYYTRRTDLSYVVNYLEKGTNKEITGSKTVDNMNFGDVVESKNDVIEVYGYKFDSADKETLTITTGENVINLYYIKKDTKVTVHFYEENSTTKVSEDVVIPGKVFDRYEAVAAEDVASKYELIGTPDNAIGKMTEEEIVVTFYYRKKATKVIVHFYEEETTNKLSENVVIDGRVDDRYTTTAAEDVPIKYELVGEPSNKNGSMTEQIIEVTYFYRVKDTYLNIRYLEKGTNIELATPERQNGKVEEDYITDAKVIEGYTLVEDSGNTTGKLTIAPITVTFYYLQNTSVEVNHIDKNTDEVLEKVTVDGLVGDKYTANAKDIANYVLVERPRVETVTMSKDKITLNYYYVHVSAGVIEKHVDVITGDILANAIHEGNEGDAYNIPSRTFEGYDLVREKMPSNARGTMTIEPIEVTYYYKYRSSVTVEYIDTITNRKLASDIVINGYEADDYITERKEFDGYKLVEVPANSEGKMTKAPIKVTYRYVHESAGVEVKHIDIKTGKELVKAELIPGYEADEYTTKPQNIPGYDLVKDRIPTNAEGKMTIDKITVEYYYIKQSSVTAKYIDKITSEEIEEEVLIEGHEGDKYETEAKEIEGYDLVEEPENAEGIMGAEPSEVIYEYHRPAKVIINYIDVDTNEEITEPEVIEGHQDDPYETEAKEIKYYNLVEDKLPKNAKGKMTVNVTKDKKKELVDDETVVNYYYKKMEFSIKVDKIIDRVILNGNTLNINGDVGKIEINKKELPNAKLQIIYKIRVINNGELVGKATLLEKLPIGTTMSKADNQLWDISGATATMTTEEIKPGETKEYTVILDWTNSEGNVGNKENKVDVLKTENEAGFDEGKVDLEDSDADLVISISTGSSTYIIVTGVAMIVLAGISIVLVKKTKEE